MSEDNGGYDIGAIADQIGKDIFGGEDSSGGGEPTGGVAPPAPGAGLAASPPPPHMAGPANPPGIPDEDKWKDMPKAWKQDKRAVWDRLMADKEAREYIHAREADVVKGFEQYTTGHKSWTELTSPFTSLLQQHPNINPVQLMQTLMRNHVGILQASPEQKRVIAQNILKSYGIELNSPGATPANTQALPPEFQGIPQTVNQLRDELGRFKQAETTRAIEAERLKIEAFAADPKHKYFEEVGDDILHLLQTGAAPTLESAYEKAIWTNPVVRAKLLAETAAGNPPPPKQPLNVDGTGGTPPAKPKTGDDTIDAVMQKHYGPNWNRAH